MDVTKIPRQTESAIQPQPITLQQTATPTSVQLRIENVRMLDRYNVRNVCMGNLFVTTTHLLFVEHNNNKATWIYHTQISSVEKLSLSTTGSPLLVRCKTFLSVTFVIPRERDCHEVYNALQSLSKPAQAEDLYCYRYTCASEDIPKSAGWNFFDIQAEFQRMRVPNDQWALTLLNQNYELCNSYPKFLFVPALATQSILEGSAKFRSKGRLPVLTYLHKNKAAICRCSQPLSGFNARCLDDEKMLDCVLRTNVANHMVVVDTRPRINAMANRATGKGYENENFYDNIKFHFLGIENIHVMRSSISKLVESCEARACPVSSYLNGLEVCGWLKHIKSVLDTSWFIAQAIESGVNVLVHCSDGWDRTAQVCSIASMLLDPYYRTIQGYQALIEKDWLNFGHKFSDRIGHLPGDPKEISPVFTQFIECTWQLMQQFPSAFQFNEHFLLTLHDHTSSCQYGTFIGNSEKERNDLRVKERTYSLWGYMANHSEEYFNALYDFKEWNCVLSPNLSSQSIKFWRGLFYRFEGGVHPREVISDLLLVASNHSNSLEQHIKLLNKKINLLKASLVKKGKLHSTEINSPGPAGDDSSLNCTITYTGNSPRTINKLVRTKGTKESQLMHAITEQITTLALDWKSFRNFDSCSCSTPFDHFTKKYHCWQCGDVFCTRCIDNHITLPGHISQCSVPVCEQCYRKIKGTISLDS
uniref:phosphatidylinositol-3,5-bisphosphate 3-phosphatase n=1 Tax=Lygus hesperus TaxID=30085 RepID=A0A0A9W4V3_LYGHE